MWFRLVIVWFGVLLFSSSYNCHEIPKKTGTFFASVAGVTNYNSHQLSQFDTGSVMTDDQISKPPTSLTELDQIAHKSTIPLSILPSHADLVIAGGQPITLPIASDEDEMISMPPNGLQSPALASRASVRPASEVDVLSHDDNKNGDSSKVVVRSETENQLKQFYGSSIPSSDKEGDEEGRIVPKPGPTDPVNIVDKPAVNSHIFPTEPSVHQTIPTMPSQNISMGEVTNDENSEQPCVSCFGHPHNICNLHGWCDNGVCRCYFGWTGENCQFKRCAGGEYECNQNGYCDNTTNICICDDGWMGEDCSVPWPNCPTPGEDLPECSGIEHGTCLKKTGVCQCNDPWDGQDCSRLKCPGKPECSSNGQCWFGKCICAKPYMGTDCSQLICPGSTSMCEGHGRCDNGTCHCDLHWFGEDCSQYACPGTPMCNGHGKCVEGFCQCEENYRGGDCGIKKCGGNSEENGCNNHGTCVDGVCECDPAWKGTFCEIRQCSGSKDQECSGHGICWHGLCECEEGWSGASCSVQTCPSDCNGNGICIGGVCRCEPQWRGLACDEIKCPAVADPQIECEGHGDCIRGHCVCS
eukprot:c21773_g2_i2.p1 GENE.c21773_g2_i2~~c21773_g2_i2.p1  ORF type:complete len:581 (+),score=300.50 c21773_g2_i2:41-1783(+)